MQSILSRLPEVSPIIQSRLTNICMLLAIGLCISMSFNESLKFFQAVGFVGLGFHTAELIRNWR